MATLFNENGDGLLVVVKGCESAGKGSEIKISTHSVGSSSQHYRTYCYVDGALDLNGSVQVYTQAEFDAEFATGIPDLTTAEVASIATASITLFAIAFGAKMLFRFVWSTRAGRF
tara:strand:- start:58 stop:402 length:345 start_codon:yes stop_codon:yes gene_type:complete